MFFLRMVGLGEGMAAVAANTCNKYREQCCNLAFFRGSEEDFRTEEICIFAHLHVPSLGHLYLRLEKFENAGPNVGYKPV